MINFIKNNAFARNSFVLFGGTIVASLLNYLFGLTRIRFWPYMLWTAVGRAPGLFLYAYLGTLGQLGLNLARGKSHPRIMEYWTWGGAFAITVLLFILLTRMALRALREIQANPGAESVPAIDVD